MRQAFGDEMISKWKSYLCQAPHMGDVGNLDPSPQNPGLNPTSGSPTQAIKLSSRNVVNDPETPAE